MADSNHMAVLRQGVDVWNAWRDKNRSTLPDLSGADLMRADLVGVDLSEANLRRANFSRASLSGAKFNGATLIEANLRRVFLSRANLSGAKLNGAGLDGAYLQEANLVGAILDEAMLDEAILDRAELRGATLRGAYLRGANLRKANLSGADLGRAVLDMATLVESDLTDADLTGCSIYGISAWGLKVSESTKQKNLLITAPGEPEITVDDIEVSQFLYLMLQNRKIRRIVDSITSKVVLILGRFTPERKEVLEALRDELRKAERDYVPVVFDFEQSRSQTTVETVTLLARMARFVIVDLSDAKSVLQELQAIVPNSPMLPVQPVIVASQDEPGMFDFFRRFPWVLSAYRYNDLAELAANLDERVVRPVETKVLQLRGAETTK